MPENPFLKKKIIARSPRNVPSTAGLTISELRKDASELKSRKKISPIINKKKCKIL
jgi:hypothetical protein